MLCAAPPKSNAPKPNAMPTWADHRLFRIGINLGDVIVEGDDIHGDGVNIADRLQGLAEPGRNSNIRNGLRSGADQIRRGVCRFLGEQQVKNIAKPVRAYRVLMDPAAAGTTIHTVQRAPSWFRARRGRAVF